MNTAIIKPQWGPLTIALMVLGFVVWWPLGLAMLAYILWGLFPLYFRWLAPRRWLLLMFHSLALFAVMLTALPLIQGGRVRALAGPAGRGTTIEIELPTAPDDPHG